jgi:spermidine synthase
VSAPAALALLGLFLSGAAGLIDEVCWIRRSSLVFGSTIHALSTVLMVFFLGLALGSWAFGHLAQRARHPLRLCAMLEVGLAALVLATIPALGAVESVYGQLYRALAADSPLLWIVRAGLIGSILLPPTFLMGGTLPLFTRQLVRDPKQIGGPIAHLYALNTLGAAAGCLVAALLLLPAIGMTGALIVAALLNLTAAALIAVAGARNAAPELIPPERAPAPVARDIRIAVAVLVFLAGFVALGEEVLWTRFLALVIRSTVLTYTITLTVVLIGIVLGSALVGFLADRVRARARWFGALQVASGLLVWLLMMLPPATWRALGSEVAVASALLLPPAILAGASFPLAVRMVVSNPAWAGIGVGVMTALNTLGGIAGSLAIGFLVLPRFGLETSARFCTGLSLAAGWAAWLWLDRGSPRWPYVILGALAVGGWVAVPRILGTRLPADFLASRQTLVDYREGLESNVAVVRRNPYILALEIDRWWQGQDRKTHQIMAGHLPMMLHPDPRRVLVVGVGAGQTPLRVTMYDIERLDCVDIEPRIFDLVRVHYPSRWLDDPRVRILRADGRNHLTHTDQLYDVIALEVGQVFRPGVATFYTADFYRRARARLRPGGLMSQFVPLPFLSADDLRGVIATFRTVFPQATLWYNTSELLLIGSTGETIALRPERWARVTANPAIREDLQFSLWGGPEHWLARPDVLLGGFLAGGGGLPALSTGGRIYRDDRPELEYVAGRVRDNETREIPLLAALRRHLDPIRTVAPRWPEPVVAAATGVREHNLDDIEAAAYVRRAEALLANQDYAGMLEWLRRAIAAHPGNLLAHRLMGDALVQLDRLEEGERHLRQALSISDRDARVHSGLGYACHRQGEIDAAITHYRAALALDVDHAEVRNNLGAALGQQGDLAGAQEQFLRALELQPDYPEALRNLAQTQRALEASRGGGVPGQNP